MYRFGVRFAYATYMCALRLHAIRVSNTEEESVREEKSYPLVSNPRTIADFANVLNLVQF